MSDLDIELCGLLIQFAPEQPLQVCHTASDVSHSHTASYDTWIRSNDEGPSGSHLWGPMFCSDRGRAPAKNCKSSGFTAYRNCGLDASDSTSIPAAECRESGRPPD